MPSPGRRIKAAMELAGIDSFPDLARRIGQRNYGERTLRKYADDDNDEYVAAGHVLHLIAAACDLPYEFFTVDFQRLPELEARGVDPLDEIREELRELTAEVAEIQQDRAAQIAAAAEGKARTAASGQPTHHSPPARPV